MLLCMRMHPSADDYSLLVLMMVQGEDTSFVVLAVQRLEIMNVMLGVDEVRLTLYNHFEVSTTIDFGIGSLVRESRANLVIYTERQNIIAASQQQENAGRNGLK